MKSHLARIVCALSVLVAGCATTRNNLTLDCVGPQPSATATPNSTEGTLVVYSACLPNADFDRRDNYRPEYSDYRILDAQGRPRQMVNNNTGTIFQGPIPVKLPPGQYRIVARANEYGYVSVPVQVVAGKITVVHLEGGSSWGNQPGFNATNSVRLPDGEVIGWRATDSP